MGNNKRKRQIFPKAQPKLLKDSFSLNESFFVWTFKDCLWHHAGWIDCTDLKFFADHIICKLQEYEKQRWQEILNASGGKSEGHGNNNHFITADKLPPLEKKEFIRLEYMEMYEKVFSLRLTSKERLIGFVDLNVFHILWFDANHKFF